MGGKRSQAEEEEHLERATLNSAEVMVREVTEVEEPPHTCAGVNTYHLFSPCCSQQFARTDPIQFNVSVLQGL